MAPENDDMIRILEQAMEMELEGQRFYEKAAEITKDPAGKQMFMSFADDEAQHFAKLRRQQEALLGGGAWISAAEILDREPVRWQAPSIFPTEDYEVTGAVATSADDAEALQMAMKAEKESYDLYTESAVKATSPEAKSLFKFLAAEEMGHHRLLASALEYLGNTSAFFLVEERSLNEG